MNFILLRFFISIILISIIFQFSSAQTDSVKLFRKRKIVLGSVAAVAYTGSVIGLSNAWYKQYKTEKFHFFNDNSEWLQMDKVGHAYTTYTLGLAGMQTLRWAGVKEKKAIWLGGFTGTFYLTTIEMFDAYSQNWGFSWGDMGANAAGSLLVCLQEQFWKEQRLQLKFSFYRTNYPQYRPDLLGNNFSEQVLKDYNGQIYWLSANVSSFLKKENKFPKWLNIAVGYGADGMTGGMQNIVIIDADGNTKDFLRQRQYYFSLDCDLTKIKTRSKFLKSVFRVINILKIPAPALELTGGKMKLLVK
ncbi:MAG: DUF2279 domain-containing protein [Bacteroidia bacterium]|nr:DUF2279 domain-containing protein [Bacteroidia bacterium]